MLGEALKMGLAGQAQAIGGAANTAAQTTIQEQQNAINNLGSVSGQLQGENLGAAQLGQANNQFNAGAANTAAGQAAGFQQQTNLSNTANSQQTALANQASSADFQNQQNTMIAQLQSQGMSLEQAQAQANMSMAEYSAGSQADQAAAAANHNIAQQNADTSSFNAGVTAFGALDKASDKRVKKNVKNPNTKEISSFLNHLAAKSYIYKNQEKYGKGPQLGVMAQDLEKSKLGSEMVHKDNEGIRRVDYGKGYAAIVAGLAHLNEKINELEKLKKGKK